MQMYGRSSQARINVAEKSAWLSKDVPHVRSTGFNEMTQINSPHNDYIHYNTAQKCLGSGKLPPVSLDSVQKSDHSFEVNVRVAITTLYSLFVVLSIVSRLLVIGKGGARSPKEDLLGTFLRVKIPVHCAYLHVFPINTRKWDIRNY